MATVAVKSRFGNIAESVHTPAERISSAADTFRARPIPVGLSHLDRQYLRGDQASDALYGLIGYLEGLVRSERLTPETAIEAVEYAVKCGLAAAEVYASEAAL